MRPITIQLAWLTGPGRAKGPLGRGGATALQPSELGPHAPGTVTSRPARSPCLSLRKHRCSQEAPTGRRVEAGNCRCPSPPEAQHHTPPRPPLLRQGNPGGQTVLAQGHIKVLPVPAQGHPCQDRSEEVVGGDAGRGQELPAPAWARQHTGRNVPSSAWPAQRVPPSAPRQG